MRHLTWVTIEEVKKGDWAIGGKIPNPKPKGSQKLISRKTLYAFKITAMQRAKGLKLGLPKV